MVPQTSQAGIAGEVTAAAKAIAKFFKAKGIAATEVKQIGERRFEVTTPRARSDSKSTSGRGVHTEVRSFARSRARSRVITWRPQVGERRIKLDLQVRLVKVRKYIIEPPDSFKLKFCI